MSHFTVLVIGENPEAQLAPFQENNMGDCPAQYMEFTDNEDENRREYEEGTTTKVIMPDGRKLNSWDDEFRVNDSIGHGSGTHKVPDHLEKREIKFTEIYKTFEEYMSDWHGTKKRDEKTGRYGYWENPNKKWDWYSLGGRWTGYFKLKQGAEVITGSPGLMTAPAESGYGDQCLKGDVDFDSMRNDEGQKASVKYDLAMGFLGKHPANATWDAIRETTKNTDEARTLYWDQPRCIAWKEAEKENFKNDKWPFGFMESPDQFLVTKEQYIESARNSAISTFAIIKDGAWFEKGEMGWWGIVSNEKHQDNWNSEFSKLIDSLPEDILLSVYDCHI